MWLYGRRPVAWALIALLIKVKTFTWDEKTSRELILSRADIYYCEVGSY